MRFTRIIGFFSAVILATALVNGARETILPAKGRCISNSTHWGDDFGIEKLPACWTARCERSGGLVTIALRTPCNLGFDIEYSQDEQGWLLYNHCYPSNRGELPDNQCCGGYKICAHQGDNKPYFNLINFYTFRNQIIYQPWFGKFADVPLDLNL